MAIVTVTVYHSHLRNMFRPFNAEETTLAVAYSVTTDLEHVDDLEILDNVWHLDNTGGTYTDAPSYFDPNWLSYGFRNVHHGRSGVGRNYRQQRSLSVGDVVLVHVEADGDLNDEAYQAYACATVGWDPIDYPVDAVVRGATRGFNTERSCCKVDAERSDLFVRGPNN